MRVSLDIQSIDELSAYLSSHPQQVDFLIAVVEKMLGEARSHLLAAETEQSFVRWTYRLDETMQVQAEVLSFVAQLLSPLFREDNIELLQQKFTRQRLDKFAGPDIPVSALIDFLEELSLQAEDAELSDLDIEIAHLEDSWEEENAAQEVDNDEVSESSPFFESTLIELAPRPPEKKGVKAYLQKKGYFIPELKATGRWGVRQTRQGYYWLKEYRFFWPHAKGTVIWLYRSTTRAIRWLRDEQEILVWLRSYRSGDNGYPAIFRQEKAPKVIFRRGHRAQLEKIYSCPDKELFRVIKGILTISKLSKEEREPFSRLKDLIALHERTLTQPETLLDVINYGGRKFDRVLSKLSAITNQRKLNRKIAAYLLKTVEEPLLYSEQIFRQSIDKSNDYVQLLNLMSRYPLFRLSLLRRYPPLRIIHTIKIIIADFEGDPAHLDRIINQHLGVHGEANLRRQLVELLVNSGINEHIWQVISHQRYLDDLLQDLKRLKNISPYKSTAGSLYQLITTFISGGGSCNFRQFKASLNFVNEKLQQKIIRLVSQHLQEELSASINTLLAKRGKYGKRLLNLLGYLKEAKYQESKVAIFGYSPAELAEKIDSLEYHETDMYRILHHTFSTNKVPESFCNLLAKALKARRASEEKNIPNSLRMLDKIEKAMDRGEYMHLHKVLVSLFKVNGQVNFARESVGMITGYQIAEEINKFYMTPNRISINLSEAIVAPVKELVERLINDQRQKQLKKMGGNQNQPAPGDAVAAPQPETNAEASGKAKYP